MAVAQLGAPIYLFLHLIVTASNKEWWGLRKKLIEKRSWYAKAHWRLMKKSYSNMNEKEEVRVGLTNLEKEFNDEENRFGEL